MFHNKIGKRAEKTKNMVQQMDASAKKLRRSTIISAFAGMLYLLAAPMGEAGIIGDWIDVGNRNSEAAHNLKTRGSEVLNYSALPKPKIRIINVTASTNEAAAVNTIDGDMDSRWGNSTYDPIWVQYELSETVRLDKIKAFRGPQIQGANVEIKVSGNGKDWTTAFKGRPIDRNGKIETFAFDPVDARYIRIVSHSGSRPHGGNQYYNEVRIGDLYSQAYVRAASPEALGESGRRLKERSVAEGDLDGDEWMGGWMAFDIATHPEKVTYITVKLWGPDMAPGELSLMLDKEDEDAPYRWISRGGASGPFWPADWKGPGREQWIYRTYPLPREEVTRGKKRVRLRLQQTGEGNARAIYAVYTHTNPHIVPPADEPQGERFEWGKTHGKAADILAEIDEEELRGKAKKRIDRIMSQDRGRLKHMSGGGLRSFFGQLCDIYNTEWSGYYKDEEIIHRVKDALDKRAREYLTTGSVKMHGNETRWAGPGRNFAQYYIKIHDGFEKLGLLDEEIQVSENKKMTRRSAYVQWFKGEFDKFHKHRRAFTNQTYYGNAGLYYLNRALLKLKPELAISEEHAQWFVYEILGSVPFCPDTGWAGGWGRASMEAGFPVHVVTDAGLTREWGYVVGYGEMTRHFAKMAGNIKKTFNRIPAPAAAEQEKLFHVPPIDKRVAQTIHARAHMRVPYTTSDGYRALDRVGLLGWRKIRYPGGIRYLDKQEVLHIGDPVSVRMAELGLEHQGRSSKYMPDATIEGVKYYNVLKESIPTDYRLPFEQERAPYAWADEGNGVFMINNNDDLIWGSFYLPAGGIGPRAVRSQARLRHMTLHDERVVDAKTDARIPDPDQFYEKKHSVDKEGHTNVFGKQKYPLPPPPPDTEWPERMFRKGRALFYQLNYGDYLIGMNTTKKGAYNATQYELDVPEKYRGKTAVDLVTGRKGNLSDPVIVGPSSTIVLYVGDE